MVNVVVNGLTSPPAVNAMVNALTSPPTVNALTTMKKTHINWGKREHRDLLAKAIQDWLNKEGDAINKNGEKILDAHLFANKLGIPPQTFYKYICTKNRRILGKWERHKRWHGFVCHTFAPNHCQPTTKLRTRIWRETERGLI
jgi:hypothetical protein